MKIALSIMISGLLLAGCGSTTVDDAPTINGASDNAPRIIRPNFTVPAGKQFALVSYVLPAKSGDMTSYKIDKTNQLLNQDSLHYSENAGTITQNSVRDKAGKVTYTLYKDAIAVSLYHDNAQDDFALYNFVNIGDVVSVNGGSCRVEAHHDTYNNFQDVLEIACPDSIGYYQKDKGLVVEKLLGTGLQTNAAHVMPFFPDRTIKGIDSFTPVTRRFSNFNVASAIEAQVDKLWAAPYYLNGQGISIGLVDGGAVLDTHVELRGRVNNLSGKDTDLHTTHVAGTLIAAGSHLPSARGFANEASLVAMVYSDYYFAGAVEKLYRDYGVLISNHSYGFEGTDGLGVYDQDSSDFDKAIKSNPQIIAVVAAGNDGEEYTHNNAFKEWGIIKGGSNAKNAITVAAIDNESNRISKFSSAGPIKGGRLKPDIATDGENVLSTSNYDNTAYKRMNGTSMATPAATGAITLLAQHYKQLLGVDIRVDTIKAILFNTAKDIENKGPDYKSGFGHLDGLKAAQVIDSMQGNSALVKLGHIQADETQTFTLNNQQAQDFKVTVAWVDAAGSQLVNDIDMYMMREGSDRKIYPYTLREFSPSAPARQDRENHTDPQEQIAFRLEAANYTLYLHAKKMGASGVDYSLVSTRSLGATQTDVVMTQMDTHIHKIFKTIK